MHPQLCIHGEREEGGGGGDASHVGGQAGATSLSRALSPTRTKRLPTLPHQAHTPSMLPPPPPPGLRRRALASSAAFLLLEQVCSLLLLQPYRHFFATTNRALSPAAADAAARDAVVKTVGAIHVVLQLPLALMVVADRQRAFSAGFSDPATLYAATPASHALIAVSAGYFFFDIVNLLVRVDANRRGVPSTSPPSRAFLIHGTLCAIGFWYGALTGRLSYYGAVFLIWEASTPFVYARWALHTAGLSSTPLYTAAGLAMTATFFAARIVFGLGASARWWAVAARELRAPLFGVNGGSIPPSVLIGYNIANVAMNSLNLFWFGKMVASIVRHFGGTGRARKAPPSPVRVAGATATMPAPATVKIESPLRPVVSPFLGVQVPTVVEE